MAALRLAMARVTSMATMTPKVPSARPLSSTEMDLDIDEFEIVDVVA